MTKILWWGRRINKNIVFVDCDSVWNKSKQVWSGPTVCKWGNIYCDEIWNAKPTEWATTDCRWGFLND